MKKGGAKILRAFRGILTPRPREDNAADCVNVSKKNAMKEGSRKRGKGGNRTA